MTPEQAAFSTAVAYLTAHNDEDPDVSVAMMRSILEGLDLEETRVLVLSIASLARGYIAELTERAGLREEAWADFLRGLGPRYTEM